MQTLKEHVFEKNLDVIKRKEIIELKQNYWKYSFDSQIKWMRENLSDNDKHILSYKDDCLVAYLDLVDIKLRCDNNTFEALGMGNVCVHPNVSHKGYGVDIVKYANSIILENSKVGVLLCHDELVEFYKKCGWIQIPRYIEITIADSYYDMNLMLINNRVIDILNIKKIAIDRNF